MKKKKAIINRPQGRKSKYDEKLVLSLTVMSMVLCVISACTQEYRGKLLPKQDESAGKWGYVDTTGKTVIAPKWDKADTFSEGLAPVKLNSKWGYIDRTGNEITPFKYDVAETFSDGLALIQLNGKWGYIDRTDNEIIPFKYDFAMNFFDGLANVRLNDKWFYIDKTGQCVKDCP